MKKPNQKGFQYEREKAKQLSLWLTNNKRDDVLWRTEGSGGRSTTANKKGKKLSNSYGDIGVKDPNSKEARDFINRILIECKRGYTNEVDVLDILDKKGSSQIIEWYLKAEKEKKECSRAYTWIIIKRNIRKDVILFDQKFVEDYYSVIDKKNDFLSLDKIFIRVKEKALYICDLKDFLTAIDLKYFFK